jgi:hypothetical protein
LWANKNDLSLSSGKDVSSKIKNLIDLLDSFKDNIICDESELLWNYLIELKDKNATQNISIDIVLDNCSIELASDLILCDYLFRNNFVSKITLHAKAWSWFISDVTKYEFDFLLKQLQSSNSIVLDKFVKRIKGYMSESKLVLEHENPFWTLPYSYDKMEKIAPDLYAYFKRSSSLVLFKGDLNYRKLIGDLNWPFDTPLKQAVREFLPTNICAFRTIKADLIAGLDLTNERVVRVQKEFAGSTSWMNTGDYGIIQFFKI